MFYALTPKPRKNAIHIKFKDHELKKKKTKYLINFNISFRFLIDIMFKFCYQISKNELIKSTKPKFVTSIMYAKIIF